MSPCCECGPRGERWRWSTCPPGPSRVSGTPPELPVHSVPPSTAGRLQVDSPAQWHSCFSWSNQSQPASRWTISLKTLTWRIPPHPNFTDSVWQQTKGSVTHPKIPVLLCTCEKLKALRLSQNTGNNTSKVVSHWHSYGEKEMLCIWPKTKQEQQEQ